MSRELLYQAKMKFVAYSISVVTTPEAHCFVSLDRGVLCTLAFFSDTVSSAGRALFMFQNISEGFERDAAFVFYYRRLQ